MEDMLKRWIELLNKDGSNSKAQVTAEMVTALKEITNANN